MAADRVLTDEQQKEFFEAFNNGEDFNADKISYLFARHKNTGIRFYTSDIITIGPEQSPFVKPDTKTTVGILLENKFIFEPLGIFGYVNKTITGKLSEKVESTLARALQEGDITREQFGDYFDRTQWLFGGPLSNVINVSLSETVMTLPPKATALRKKLLEEKKDELATNDPQVAVHIEHDVIDQALSEMRNTSNPDPSTAFFNSGCGIDPYNQYKTIVVMKGAIADNTGDSPTGYKVITSNYDTGITKEDMPKIADAVVTTAYSSGVTTQDSGTNGKRYNALFQRVRLQEHGTDCGSTDYLEVDITEGNAEDYIYRYIREGSKILMLTKDNVKSYVGKTVKMRSPLHCKAKDPEYCSVCIGGFVSRRRKILAVGVCENAGIALIGKYDYAVALFYLY